MPLTVRPSGGNAGGRRADRAQGVLAGLRAAKAEAAASDCLGGADVGRREARRPPVRVTAIAAEDAESERVAIVALVPPS